MVDFDRRPRQATNDVGSEESGGGNGDEGHIRLSTLRVVMASPGGGSPTMPAVSKAAATVMTAVTFRFPARRCSDGFYWGESHRQRRLGAMRQRQQSKI